MNSRERILAAIEHKTLDRIPTDIWATPEIWEKLQLHFGEGVDILDQLHIDGILGVWPSYTGPTLPTMPEGESIDFWGMRRKRVRHESGTYDEQVYYPLEAATTIDEVDAYSWPSVDWFNYDSLRSKAEEIREKRVVMCGYMAPFYFHNLLRGLEQSLVDPLLEPELTHHIVNRISDFFYNHHRRIFESCDGLIDVAQVTDDLGSQTGPLISMEIYREFYAPQHKRFIDLCHKFGIKVFHHDDGSIRPFIPDLLDMGIDILNPIQWTCPGMDMKQLKADFGSRVCFHGAVDNQKILPFGTPEEVRQEVRHCIDELGSNGSGYILAPCHNIQSNTPLENILAMYDEAWNYGKLS